MSNGGNEELKDQSGGPGLVIVVLTGRDKRWKLSVNIQ